MGHAAAGLVLLDIAVIIVAARLMGALFRRYGQPAVVGEIVAGILLGPTLLGALPGNPSALLFPAEVQPSLQVIAQLGLVVFMFIVGLELDLNLIRGKQRTAAAVSVASMLLPLALGMALAWLLYERHGVVDGQTIPFLGFALFVGASMSVTAFPVLARLLTERRMHRTPIGVLALACAAANDILAWLLLAVVVAVVAATGMSGLPVILLQTAAFVGFMVVVVRPRLRWLVVRYERDGRLSPDVLAVVLVGLLLSSAATAWLGIHEIFGAFLWGAILPRIESRAFSSAILGRLEPVTVLLLLPVFFVVAGLRVDVRDVGMDGLADLALIMACACVGKFGGATLAARLAGLRTRMAAGLGILMNTRGLTELVILDVGRQFGVLNEELFTLLVLMALLTTAMTAPLLRLVYPQSQVERDIAHADRSALSRAGGYRVDVVVEDLRRAPALVDTALAIVGNERPAEVVLTRLVPQHGWGLELDGGMIGELTELAAGMETLHALERRISERGIASAVLSRFSGHVATDVVAQITSVEPSLVLTGADTVVADDLPFDTAMLLEHGHAALPPPRAVAAVVEDSANTDAAVEIAVRVARAGGTDLLIIGHRGRRTERRLAETLAAVRRVAPEATSATVDGELAVAVRRLSGDHTLVVAPLGGRTVADIAEGMDAGPVLLVRGQPRPLPDRLERLQNETVPPALTG